MGCSIIAACDTCGFQSEPLMIGGGMQDFHRLCAFPAYCAKGDHLLTVNHFDSPPRCAEHDSIATPYDDAALIGEPGSACVVTWRYGSDHEAVLTDGHYFCPDCHRNTLRFSDYGLMWD